MGQFSAFGSNIITVTGFDGNSRRITSGLGLAGSFPVGNPADLTRAVQQKLMEPRPGAGINTKLIAQSLETIPNFGSFGELPKNLDAFGASAQAAFDKKQLMVERLQNFLSANPFAVRLKAVGNDRVVAFRVSPEINETRNNAYRTIDPVHMPGAIQVFTNSSPRTWNVSQIKLISRNGVEAEENLQIVNVLRSWMLPFFGKSTTLGRDSVGGKSYSAELRGAPPEVLKFTAYSDHGDDAKGVTNIRNIPVVMTNLTIPYVSDVDYIETSETKQPFPAVMEINMTLIETHSPQEYSEFDIIRYRLGRLPGF